MRSARLPAWMPTSRNRSIRRDCRKPWSPCCRRQSQKIPLRERTAPQRTLTNETRSAAFSPAQAENFHQRTQRTAPLQPNRSVQPSKHVLVIDDDAPIRTAIRVVLEREGYAVTEAANGREAIDRVRQQKPHLILCDIFMPRQDGFDTIRELRCELPRVPIVAISGGGSVAGTDALRMARRLGAAEVLHKPLHHAGLLGAIQRFLPPDAPPC